LANSARVLAAMTTTSIATVSDARWHQSGRNRLTDAAQPPAQDAHGLWWLQQRALVLTALSGVSRLLDAPQKTVSSQPALLGKLPSKAYAASVSSYYFCSKI
jgi:hypothetical protein